MSEVGIIHLILKKHIHSETEKTSVIQLIHLIRSTIMIY